MLITLTASAVASFPTLKSLLPKKNDMNGRLILTGEDNTSTSEEDPYGIESARTVAWGDMVEDEESSRLDKKQEEIMSKHGMTLEDQRERLDALARENAAKVKAAIAAERAAEEERKKNQEEMRENANKIGSGASVESVASNSAPSGASGPSGPFLAPAVSSILNIFTIALIIWFLKSVLCFSEVVRLLYSVSRVFRRLVFINKSSNTFNPVLSYLTWFFASIIF